MQHDVAIVGGSLAGCAAAVLYARAGLRVLVLEKRADAEAFKRVCTHNIQGCAAPTLRKLGLVDALRAAGAVETSTELWTRYGWIRDPAPSELGFNVRRETLDPLIRGLALETEGIEFRAGAVVQELLAEGDRVVGVRLKGGEQIRPQLVVAADGRHGKLGKLAGVPLRTDRHGRFVYYAYYEGVPVGDGTQSRMWHFDPQCAYAFPNDGGLTLLAAFITRDRLPAWKADLEHRFTRFIEALPDGPDIRAGRRVSDFFGMVDLQNHRRPAAARGMAFVGDAALAGDPLWGIGCGWALQSADWLTEATTTALLGTGDLGAALDRYRRRHARGLGLHYDVTSSYSTGRRFHVFERLCYRAAARDPAVAHTLLEFGSRVVGGEVFADPRFVARLVLANARPGGSLPTPPVALDP